MRNYKATSSLLYPSLAFSLVHYHNSSLDCHLNLAWLLKSKTLSLSAAFSMATMGACLRGCHAKQPSHGNGFCSQVLFFIHPQGFIHEISMFKLYFYHKI